MPDLSQSLAYLQALQGLAGSVPGQTGPPSAGSTSTRPFVQPSATYGYSGSTYAPSASGSSPLAQLLAGNQQSSGSSAIAPLIANLVSSAQPQQSIQQPQAQQPNTQILGGGLNTLGQYVPGLSSIGGDAGNALGIVGGLEQGGVRGDLGAAANAAKLAGNTTGTPDLTGIGSDLGSALGLYGGLQTGGVSGYGQALGSGLNLAGQLGSQTGALSGATSGALSSAGGEIAAPLAVYNALNNWQSGATGSDALQGAEAGAAVGSVFPVLGTGIGALAGGVIGAASSLMGPGRTDPEQGTWGNFLKQYQNADAAGTKAQEQQAGVSGAGLVHMKPGMQGTDDNFASGNQKFLANEGAARTAGTNAARNAVSGAGGAQDFQSLAGLFDMRSSDLPFYQQYGRMGEGQFTTDMANQIDNAIKSGKISASATPQEIYNQVVNPWISGMNNSASSTGKGWAAQGTGASGGDVMGQMQAPVQQLLTNLISNYQQGQPFYTVGGSQVSLPAYAAKGGSMDSKRRALLREVYKGPFKRFDDGGSAYNNYAGYISNNVAPAPLNYFSPALGGNTTDPYQLANGTNVPINPNLGTPGSGMGATGEGTGGLTPDQLQALEAQGTAGATGTPSLGALSGLLGSGGLGNAWSGLSTGQQVGTLGALLAGLGAIQNNGQNMTQQYKPAPPPMFANTGPRGTAQGAPAGSNMYGNFTTQPRQQINPGISNYATYGQGPTHMFFGPSASQAPGSGTTPAANTPSLQSVLAQLATKSQPISTAHTLARGGETPSNHAGRPLQGLLDGPGDGTSDDIVPAALSQGEYVVPAHVVSALGNGSNKAGAARLDELQKNVRVRTGRAMARNQHPTGNNRAKKPEAYMRGGK